MDVPDTDENRGWVREFKGRWKAKLEQVELWVVSYVIDVEYRRITEADRDVGEGMPADITPLLDESGGPPKQCRRDGFGWVPHGPCVAYRPDGTVLLEITYNRGIAHGPYRDYWRNGRVSLEGQHAAGEREGEWRFYDRETGALREVLRFAAGHEVVDWDAFFRVANAEGSPNP